MTNVFKLQCYDKIRQEAPNWPLPQGWGSLWVLAEHHQAFSRDTRCNMANVNGLDRKTSTSTFTDKEKWHSVNEISWHHCLCIPWVYRQSVHMHWTNVNGHRSIYDKCCCDGLAPITRNQKSDYIECTSSLKISTSERGVRSINLDDISNTKSKGWKLQFWQNLIPYVK